MINYFKLFYVLCMTVVLMACGGGSGSGGSQNTGKGGSNGSIIIDDDDPPDPTVQFASAAQSVSEGVATVTISITLSKVTDVPVTVPYTLSGGTAQTADYTGLTTSPIVIPVGNLQYVLTLTLIDDDITENPETVIVNIGVPTYADKGVVVIHTVTITDNDPWLNDTGITTCADTGSNSLGCPQSDYPGQDAESGRDTGTPVKIIGGGRAGFDFTKLDAAGSPLANQGQTYASQPWACIQDNVTRLIWEVKVDNFNALQHSGHNYSWYNTDDATNGGWAGSPDNGFCVNGIDCDTSAYVAAVNALNGGQGLCGKTGWRLPNVEESRSIVDYSLDSPAIDTDYFPNALPTGYWTSVTYADPAYSFGGLKGAWNLDYTKGDADIDLKNLNLRVRLVHDGPGNSPVWAAPLCSAKISATSPTDRFADNLDGTLTDERTGLMWKKCPEGQSGQDCSTGSATYIWQNALRQVETVNNTPGGFAGHTDWRLPNSKELASIIEYSCVDPAINSAVSDDVFPSTPSQVFWTSSPVYGIMNSVWAINFFSGFDSQSVKIDANNVRLVRGGQQ